MRSLEHLVHILSPTRLYIDHLKEIGSRDARTEALRKWSVVLFVIELQFAWIPLAWEAWCGNSPALCGKNALAPGLRGLLIYWAIARCTEITWAFISDAVRVLKRERPTTDLGSSERVVMAIRSYFGLLLNFALLYYCLNDQVAGLRFAGFADAFYFSGSVLAGLDLRPEPDLVLAKYLVLWQWLIGTFMIVIAVAGYLDNRTQPGGEVVPSSEESTRMPAFDSSPAEAYFFLHAFLVTLAVCYPLH